MSLHPDLRPLIEGADLPRRREILDHLVSCPACRAELAAADPSLLFSILATEPVPAGVLDQVSARAEAAVSAAILQQTRTRTYAWRALAASIVVAALGGAYLLGTGGRSTAPPALPEMLEVAPPQQPDAAMPAGMIELYETPGRSQDVVEMEVGDVDVVMIFDEALGI